MKRIKRNGYIPGGMSLDKEKCNTIESGIGKTTPVDKYPEGKSPYGCYDMLVTSGNGLIVGLMRGRLIRFSAVAHGTMMRSSRGGIPISEPLLIPGTSATGSVASGQNSKFLPQNMVKLIH